MATAFVEGTFKVDLASALERPEVDFMLLCSVLVLPREGAAREDGVPVQFEVSHVYPPDPAPSDPGELELTSVTFSAADLDRPVRTRALRSVTAEELVQLVRRWIIDDGRPNGPATETWTEHGKQDPAWATWDDNRTRFISHLKPARVGSGLGRPITRDDEYLRRLAEDAIRAHEKRPDAYFQRLAKMRSTGANAKEWEALRSDVRIARLEGWLEPTTRGSRAGPRAGPRLLEVWERERKKPRGRRKST